MENISYQWKCKRRAGTIVVALIATIISTPAISIGYHDHADILDKASRFVDRHYNYEGSGDGFEIIVSPPDKRLNVAECTDPLEAFWPYEPGSQRTVSVGVRCGGQSQWKIYLQAELKLIKNIAVLNTPVRSGDVLDTSMVSTRPVNILELRSPAINDIAQYIGMKFTRSLRSGTPLSRGILEIPAIIKRGDYINILSGKGVVQVAAKGYALADGYLNDTIKVRNTDSKKVIQVLVIDQGYVRTLR